MQMLLALMDEAYTGSTIADGGVDSESEDSSAIDAADPFFLEFLKDENDGLPVRFLPWLIFFLLVDTYHFFYCLNLQESLGICSSF